MPQIPWWAESFAKTVASIASQFKEFPEINRDELEAIEDRINAVWLDPKGTWEEFQEAVGNFKMFFFIAGQRGKRS